MEYIVVIPKLIIRPLEIIIRYKNEKKNKK